MEMGIMLPIALWGGQMFEVQYNEEMEREVARLEARNRATLAGHPEWDNACAGCGCQLAPDVGSLCESCH